MPGTAKPSGALLGASAGMLSVPPNILSYLAIYNNDSYFAADGGMVFPNGPCCGPEIFIGPVPLSCAAAVITYLACYLWKRSGIGRTVRIDGS